MSATIAMVSPRTLARWLEDGCVEVIDVREAHEFANGHIPGAHHNPLSRFDPTQVPTQGGRMVVFHCQLGFRCGPASQLMAAAGYDGTLYRLDGGFKAWQDDGGAVELPLEHTA